MKSAQNLRINFAICRLRRSADRARSARYARAPKVKDTNAACRGEMEVLEFIVGSIGRQLRVVAVSFSAEISRVE